MRSEPWLLFSKQELQEKLAEQVRQVQKTIEEHDPNKLLNTNTDDLVAYFASECAIDPIALRDDAITIDVIEQSVDVSNDPNYARWGDGRRTTPGAAVGLHVPFDGDAVLFQCRPSTFDYAPPSGVVSAGELVLSFVGPQNTLSYAKRQLDDQLASVRRYIGWIVADVDKFNAEVPAVARANIEGRKRHLLEHQGLAASFGYPLKRRASVPQTYAVPTARKKVFSRLPEASSAPFVPEPVLDHAIYEQILQILGNMVRVMEQSPGAFASMKEEDLRTHFLVQLNGQFEGGASGETFRGNGSTDILLTTENKSVFIAECKFWNGPASLTSALEQLLDYSTWRDAKAAILVFNRGTEFTKVIEAVPTCLADYPSRASEVIRLGETVFQLRVRQRDDVSRHLEVTIMVYNVPTTRSRSRRLKGET